MALHASLLFSRLCSVFYVVFVFDTGPNGCYECSLGLLKLSLAFVHAKL
jgi:hypothetical protein